MKISFEAFELESESQLLAEFLSRQSWPFHVHSKVSAEEVLQSVSEGNYSGEANQTFWILANESEKVGLVRLMDMDDLEDGSPIFDIRLLEKYQGNGIGLKTVQWLTCYVFEGWPKLTRIEGTTRIDNISMRKVFERSGYVKEGHYRKSWPDENGVLKDTLRYAILRVDWSSGKITAVDWLA